MKSGIYKITNIANGKLYIGSSIDIRQRLRQHKSKLLSGKHVNKHLQYAYKKYGISSFTFCVILYCDEDNLIFFENRFIHALNTLDGFSGYNIMPASRNLFNGSNYDDMKKRLSIANTGYIHTDEAKRKIAYASKHRIITDKTKEKISNSRKGIHFSSKTLKKMSEARLGSKLSAETKKKISKAMKGRKLTDAWKNKIGEGNGIPVIINGVYYQSITSAAKMLKDCRKTINLRINGGNKGYTYANKGI